VTRLAQIAAGHFQDLACDLCLPLGLLRSATTTQTLFHALNLGRSVRPHEDVNFATWARRRGHFRWGKRLRLTTPGAIQARVLGEARLLKGTLTPLPLILALSSRCICGARATKPLSQRSHHCLVCGFGPVDRDLLSALLGREATVTGRTIDLGPTPFTGQTRATAETSCQAAGRTVVIPRTVKRPKAELGRCLPTLQTGRRRRSPTNPFVRHNVPTDPITTRVTGDASQQLCCQPCVVEIPSIRNRGP